VASGDAKVACRKFSDVLSREASGRESLRVWVLVFSAVFSLNLDRDMVACLLAIFSVSVSFSLACRSLSPIRLFLSLSLTHLLSH